MLKLFKVTAALIGLRVPPLDIFSFSIERRLEHKLVCDYEALLIGLEEDLTQADTAGANLAGSSAHLDLGLCYG